MAIGEKIDFLFRKINGGFHIQSQMNQSLD